MALPRIASIRAVLQWPARFLASTGLTAVKSGDTTTISLAVNDLTLEASPDLSNDYIPIWDASASAHRKITVNSAAASGYSGLEFNTRLAKTANYTLVNADKGKTIGLGGSAFFTLTIGAAAGFDADFIVRIVNEDGDRAKRISPNGLTSFRLWPKQVCHLINLNGVWHVEYPARYENHEGLELFVGTAGADTNDGLGTGAGNALLTLQAAVDILQDEWGANGGLINVAAGTYTAGASVTHDAIFVNFVGDAATPGNVIISPGAAQTCFSVQDNAVCSINGFRLQSSGAGSTGIHSRQLAIVDFLNCEFGTMASGSHISAEDNAFISAVGNYAITGDAATHVSAGHGSKVNLDCTVTIGTARAFTVFASASFGGMIRGATTFSGAGVAGTTGIRFTGIGGGSVNDANTYPGSTAGFIYGGDPAYGGTAAVPFYNFGSLDENTGAYRIGADNWGVAVGGTKAIDADTAGVSILGTTTNDSAASGWVGEYGEAELASGSATSLVTATAKTVASISLPPGDLEVWGQICFSGGATTTVEYMRASVSATTNTENTDALNRGQANGDGGTPFATGEVGVRVGPIRLSLAAITTYHLVGIASFGVSTCVAYGKVAYRRLR